MKTLCLLQGAPGSGKSTFIKENGLEEYTLCPDTIRLMLMAPEMTADCYAIPQKENRAVFDLLHQMLEIRMRNGSFTVIDAKHKNEKSLSSYKRLAKLYGYRVYLIRFDVPLETVLERNRGRKAAGRFVPEDVVRQDYQCIKTFSDHNWYTVISPEQFKDVVYQRFEHLDVPVVHIGDIHGCYSALSQLEYDPNKKYVFLGDYFDRGIENGKVAKMLIKWMKYPNVVFLCGNHEKHLERFFNTGEYATKQFKKSMDDILSSGVTIPELKTFFKRMALAYCYEKDGKKVICTHAGLPFVPKDVRLLNTQDLLYGAGGYDLDVDKLFQPEDSNIWQVHGHRNSCRYPAAAGPRSWNLNSVVEGGQPLRVLTLDKDWEVAELECSVYDPQFDENAGPYWSMYKDKDVVSKKTGNIVSFNFSRDTFWDKKWTETTMMARGMFCDKRDQRVLARGYEKFFTFRENSMTSEERIKNLTYPLTAYRKENGYLGLVGVYEDELLFCSKSSVESEYAGWLKDIFMKTVPDPQAVLEYLKSNNKCMVFEVVDMEHDPHIIEYSESKIILLDILDRSFVFTRLPYEQMCRVGRSFGMEVKAKIAVLHSYEEFLRFSQNVGRFDYEEKGEKVEGYVLEDASEDVFHFKLKTGFYKFWKIFRNGVERNQLDTLSVFMRNCALCDLDAEKPRMRELVDRYKAMESKPTLFEMQKL